MSPLVVELELELERKQKLERKLKLSGGLMPVPPKFNAYTNRLGFLCPSIVARRTYKKTDKLGLLAPRGVDPRSPNFQGM